MNISTTRLLDFKPSLMKSVDKDGKVCPTANSYQLHHPPPACKPHQGSRTINPLSHPRIARYAMLVTPLGFLKSSYWNNPKGTWFLETLNGLISVPYRFSASSMHASAARASDLGSVFFHCCYHPNSIRRRVHLPQSSYIRIGCLLLTNLIILKSHYLKVET